MAPWDIGLKVFLCGGDIVKCKGYIFLKEKDDIIPMSLPEKFPCKDYEEQNKLFDEMMEEHKSITGYMYLLSEEVEDNG